MTSSIPMDREDPDIARDRGIYNLSIEATEVGDDSSVSTAPVTIVITDVDDRKPTFSRLQTTVEVSEDLVPQTPVTLSLKVTDEDEGDNARFLLGLEQVEPSLETPQSTPVFSLSPLEVQGTSPLYISLNSGKKLDFETQKAYKYRIIASSIGGTVESTSEIEVAVVDVNDNKPVFFETSYRTSVSEMASAGSVVTDVLASDADITDSLSYSITGFGASHFKVIKGQVVVAECSGRKKEDSCLDYERQKSYTLSVKATDMVGNEASAELIVDLLDENDNSPVFEQLVYRRDIGEGMKEFMPPLRVIATDMDGPLQGGGRITYTLVVSEPEQKYPFMIDGKTGEVRPTSSLSHLDTPTGSYTLKIRATDSGTPSRYDEVQVIISVGGIVNRPPRFKNQTYNFKVREDAKSGFLIGNVKAQDSDGKVEKYLLDIEAGDTFEIDEEKGEIRLGTSNPLNFLEKSEYKITALAVDSGQPSQTATSEVKITVVDVNNMPPKFVRERYTGFISSLAAIGTDILRLTAEDPDTNARLGYTVSDSVARGRRGQESRGVGVTGVSVREDGSVFVSGSVGDASVITLNVTVTDLASEIPDEQTDTALVTIYVHQVGGSAPVFSSPWSPSHPHMNFTINENTPLDQEVFSLAATDPNTGEPVTRYQKLSDHPIGVFSVDQISGSVKLLKPVDFEDLNQRNLSLVVSAVSGDTSSRVSVYVRVKDVNDNSPVFQESSYSARVPEDLAPGGLVTTVQALDADSGDFGTIRYEISGRATRFFTVDAVTGEVRVAAALDREKSAVIAFTVTATDAPESGGGRRWATTRVTVELSDVNDERPQWASTATYTAVVAENVPEGTAVATFTATDPDEGNSKLYRFICILIPAYISFAHTVAVYL